MNQEAINKLFDFKPERVQKIITQSNEYLKAYPVLLELAKSNFETEHHAQIALSLAAYGWMPTIPKSMTENSYLYEVIAIDSQEEAIVFLENLKEPLINNSWVGSSKILHFANPKYFAIWDAKVAKRLEIPNHWQSMAKKSNYKKYITTMHNLDKLKPSFGEPLAYAINKRFGYYPSNLRCLELCLFCNDE